MPYPLGRRIAVESAGEWPAAARDAAVLLGAAGIRLSAAGRRSDREQLHRLERAWSRRVVERLRIDLRIEGLAHVDPARGYIVAPLHESFADVPTLFHLPLDLRFVARDELVEWRLLGACLRNTGQITVDPERPRAALRAILRGARTALDEGESIVMFPQGTILGIETAFREGVDWLAGRLGVPILPVVLAGGHRVWEWPFSPMLRYRMPVYLEVLAPVAAGELTAAAGRMRERALDNGHAPARHFEPDRDGYWDGYDYEIDPGFDHLAARVARHRARS